MKWIDTHAHLYDEQFFSTIDNFVTKAIDEGVAKIYLPNCDQHTITSMLEIAKLYPDVLKPMMGLHPCYVKDDYKDELVIVRDWLQKEKFAAVGEIGLDYYWDITHKAQQQDAFDEQMSLALAYQLPIVIHTRDSIDDGIAMVKNRQNGQLKGIFHCFSGTIAQAEQIIDLGFLLGIGGVVTYKKSTLPEVVAAIDLKHLVLETDAPYLAPVPYRGKRNESNYIPIIGQAVANIKNVPLSDVAAITTANAKALYKY